MVMRFAMLVAIVSYADDVEVIQNIVNRMLRSLWADVILLHRH